MTTDDIKLVIFLKSLDEIIAILSKNQDSNTSALRECFSEAKQYADDAIDDLLN